MKCVQHVRFADLQPVPAYQLAAARAVLAEREAELLELKGPCRAQPCRLHLAHRGPCVPSESTP